MPTYTSFQELDCYKKCRKLRIWVHEFLTAKISKNEFDIRQNMLRAARSTTRNIAEGFGRHHHKENMHFCRISRGSLYEIEEDLIICVDEEHVSDPEITEGKRLINDSLKSVNGYIKYLNTLI